MNKKKYFNILSLDIWDTIIRRDCHPDEIKAMSSEYINAKYNNYLRPEFHFPLELTRIRLSCENALGVLSKKNGYDDEYELHDVLRELLKRTFRETKVISDEIIDDIYNYELNSELAHSRLDSQIVDTIQQYSYDQLIIISDFYADATFLSEIIKKNNFPFLIDHFFVSCEAHYNKRSSRLFQYVQDELQLSGKSWLHIGDNINSDVQIPRSLGIVTKHFQPQEEHFDRLHREQNFKLDLHPSVTQYHDFPVHKKGLSVFFTGFAGWIAEQCLQKGIKKLYFFTREGEFYKQVFDMWKMYSRYSNRLPDSYILEVSRVATFLPSLREVSLSEMMRIWNQYSCQSMAAFFKSLRLNPERGKYFTEKYNINYEQVLIYPWQLETVQAMFRDAQFIEWIQQEILSSRSLLLKYCHGKGLYLEKQEVIGIVDIGWRGTIQDNLCYVFPDYRIEGFYIGLVPFLNQQPANSRKAGYINSYPKAQSLFHTLTPFEMICNSPNGSTVSYEETEAGVNAVRKKERGEDFVFHAFTKQYQEQILSEMKCLCEWNQRHYIISEQYHDAAFNALHHFCYYPDIKCANAYFSLVHNEEFGVGEYVDKRTTLKILLLLEAIFSKKKRKQLKEFLINTTWPQGYLTKYHLYPLLKIYNHVLRTYDAKL